MKKTESLETPSSEDIRKLSESMDELAHALRMFVSYLDQNPEIKDIPESIRELTKRISVLSTRL